MANTSDTFGVQTTLDKLIAHELTSFEDDTVTYLRIAAFMNNDVIESIKLPACSDISSNNTFAHCSLLRVLDLSQQVTFNLTNAVFSRCGNFAHLILRSETLCPLLNAFYTAFSGTKIGLGFGAIYVPSNLVDTYKSATNWSAAAGQIYALEDYPVTDFSTIKDDWDTIITNLGNGTANYVVGDTKTMDYDGTPVLMELVALEADDLADNSGKAKSTWISKSPLETHNMHSSSTTTNGWAACDTRTYLRGTVINKIPSNIRSAIKEVTKTYRTKSPNDETLAIADTVWIPSFKEVGFTNASYVESDGVVYSDVFKSNTTRIKYNADGATYWWLRSAYDAYNYSCVSGGGVESSNRSNYPSSLVLGFCI